MKVLLIGGGSGGHIQPLISVLGALYDIDPSVEVSYVGDKKDKFSRLIVEDDRVIRSKLIFSGKFRRYENASKFDFATFLQNVRDLLYVSIGFFQALVYIKRFRPDVVFSKGGFPAVPVGLAAAVFRVPILTHDSDAKPSLTNKVLSRWATLNLVGTEQGSYPYPKEKIRVVGVPLGDEFVRKQLPTKSQSRKMLAIHSKKPLLLIIGGSLGAGAINTAVIDSINGLTELAYVVHITGRSHFEMVSDAVGANSEYEAIDFISDQKEYFSYLNAADLVVSRAGATSVAEIAVLRKPAIIIPAAQLADQQMNKVLLADAQAALVIEDQDLAQDSDILLKGVQSLIDSRSPKAKKLASNVASFAKKDASEKIASYIFSVSHGDVN